MNNPTVPVTVTFLVALGLGYTVIFIVMGSFFNHRYQELVKELRTENRLLKGQPARRAYTPPTLRLVEPPFPDAYPEAYIETGYDIDDDIDDDTGYDIDDAPTVTDHMTDHWTDNPPVAHPPN